MITGKIVQQNPLILIASTLLRRLLVLTGVIAIAMIILLSIPKVRHGIFLFGLEIPGIVTHFFLQQYVDVRRFDKALPWLERELDLINWFAPPRNQLLPGLIDNTAYAFERARFPEEFNLFLPFLRRLVKSHPDLYPARLWLARTLAETDPASAFEHLEVATKLSSADSMSYRIAIALALKEKSGLKLKNWCDRYHESQLGGLDPMDYNNFFNSIGLREMALEVINPSGESQIIENRGIQLGGSHAYEFILTKGVEVRNLRLHLGVVPGIAISIKQIKFYLHGKGKATFEKNIVLTTWSGFHLDDGRILTMSRDGEIINIHPPKEGFGAADKVEINLRFNRLGLASPAPCGEKSPL